MMPLAVPEQQTKEWPSWECHQPLSTCRSHFIKMQRKLSKAVWVAVVLLTLEVGAVAWLGAGGPPAPLFPHARRA